MKAAVPIVTAAMCLLIPAACGQASSIPPADQDPFVGSWQQKKPTQGREKKAGYTRTMTRDGDFYLFSSYDEKGKHERSYRYRCDGQFYSVPTGLLSCRYVTPDSVEGETRSQIDRDGFWRRTVSKDGKEMTIESFRDRDHKKLQSRLVLYRVP